MYGDLPSVAVDANHLEPCRSHATAKALVAVFGLAFIQFRQQDTVAVHIITIVPQLDPAYCLIDIPYLFLTLFPHPAGWKRW